MSKQFICTKHEPIVNTKAGKIRGFRLNGTYTFRGIKYANAQRFMMPTPVEHWEGVKDATRYGHVAPVIDRPTVSPDDVLFGFRYWPENEECQYINVWTQSLEPKAKKPVMFWIHGGGYFFGSSVELIGYEGENLSKNGDVVVVSLNHRLNILGFLNLSEYGEEFANSANVGMADIVAGLQWVRDNIEQFGGDPENVTIFGQSGGGGKVISLLQIPEAADLFSKAIIQSGAYEYGPTAMPESSTAVARAVVDELGISADNIEELQKVPYEDLAKAYNKVAPILKDKGISTAWAPVQNDYYIGHPLNVGFSGKAKNTPTIIGTTIGEFCLSLKLPDRATLSEGEKQDLIAKRYGKGSDKLIQLFKQAYPNKDLIELMYLDYAFRKSTVDYLDKKVQSMGAPIYSYMLAYVFPFDDGKPAWHSADIPFVFRNSTLVPAYNIPGEADRLEEQLSGAWVSFARTGEPNHPAIPHWSTYEKGKEATMVFDVECEERIDYDRELIKLHRELSPPFVRP